MYSPHGRGGETFFSAQGMKRDTKTQLGKGEKGSQHKAGEVEAQISPDIKKKRGKSHKPLFFNPRKEHSKRKGEGTLQLQGPAIAKRKKGGGFRVPKKSADKDSVPREEESPE